MNRDDAHDIVQDPYGRSGHVVYEPVVTRERVERITYYEARQAFYADSASPTPPVSTRRRTAVVFGLIVFAFVLSVLHVIGQSRRSADAPERAPAVRTTAPAPAAAPQTPAPSNSPTAGAPTSTPASVRATRARATVPQRFVPEPPVAPAQQAAPPPATADDLSPSYRTPTGREVLRAPASSGGIYYDSPLLAR